MRKNKKEALLCPNCGSAMVDVTEDVVAVVTVSVDDEAPCSCQECMKKRLPKSAQERIEILRNAGVDVSNMFAMTGANGGEFVASNQNGKLTILDDNDPIYNQIMEQGTVPNRRLFRRWVMAQMFHMLSARSYHSQEPVGVTYMIRRLGYEYQWKMLLNELQTQMKMEGRDPINFADRNRWFNKKVVIEIVEDYIAQLQKHVKTLKVKKCKGIPYKRIAGRDIFVSDINKKLYAPFHIALGRIKQAKSMAQLYNATKQFNGIRIKMSQMSQSKAWIDAYKGSGAFFTMQNLIRFHNCTAFDDADKRLDKAQSLFFIEQKAEMYKDGEGWRLLAVMKKMLEDNNINIKKKQAEWAKK